MTGNSVWHNVWTAPGERLFVQALAEEGWTRHRMLSNSEGDGAVAVVVDGSRILFIHANRPAIGRSLWELPRGQADAGDASPESTAARELLEETGLVALRSRLLGQVWAESGLCGDAVNVVLINVDPRGIVQPAEYSVLRWVELESLGQEVAEGRVRDGITLSALALAWAKGGFNSGSLG